LSQALFQDAALDLRQSVRALRRAPAFTLVAAVTLALGIGAATAVFSVLNGVLIKPLPYPDPGALVSIWNTSPSSERAGRVPLSATQWFTYRDENRVFAELGLWSSARASVTGSPGPEEIETLRVTDGTLQALGVRPAMGRWFSRQDDGPGSPESVMLTDSYWKRRYGGDRAAIGQSLLVDGLPRTIIGVMPVGFRFLDHRPDLIMPFRFNRNALLLGAFNYQAVGRLKPGVTLERASADLARMNETWLNAWPSPAGFEKERFAKAPALRPLKQDVVGDIGNVLWVSMVMVGTVLIIACANVANLLLVRGERRRHELGIRAALGAGRLRLARQQLLESVLIGLCGGGLGVALAYAAVRVLVALSPASLPRLDDIGIDGVALTFAVVATLGSSVAVGLFPIMKHVGPAIGMSLRAGDRASSSAPERQRTRDALVVAQVSLALVLLVGAGLMMRTFLALRAVQPGFAEPAHVQLVRLTFPEALLQDPVRVFRLQSDIQERVAAVPGVAAVSLTSAAPMEPFVSANVLMTAAPFVSQGQVRRFKFVSPGYFATVGTPVVAGRDFEWRDLQQRRPVAVVSESLAREIWRAPAAAVGQRIRESPQSPWREIVGIVSDVHDDGLHAAPPAIAYWPSLMENFEGDAIRVRRSMTLAIRSPRAGTESFIADIQRAVWAANANLPLARVQTLQTVYQRSLARTSFTLVMLAIAASVALLLGLLGVYSVIAYAVAQQTREIGIRVALGASPSSVRRTFVRRGVVLGGVGVAIGLTSAMALTGLMSSLLFGVDALDPLTYLAVGLVFVAAAGVASYVPAYRASVVDPVKALRAQ
jgi:predicted permease